MKSVSLRQLPFAPAVLGRTAQSNAWLIVAAVALLTLSAKVQIPLWPVPFTYDQLRWGYVVALAATAVAFAAATAAAVRRSA